jgi:calcineurin-like phosphoesterase family protein
MLRPLRLDAPDHKTFMVSDLHLNHARVATKRGLEVPVHDNGVVNSWNKTCDMDSHVISLGDIISDDRTGDKLKTFLRRVNFHTIFLLPGNHTSGYSALYKKFLRECFPDAVHKDQIMYEVYPLTMRLDDGPKQIVFLPNYVEMHINKTVFCLSHYPIVSHNRMGRESIHCCGHSHQNCAVTNIKTGRGKRLDVGWEGFGKPVSVSEIRRLMEGRDIDAWDHHEKHHEGA